MNLLEEDQEYNINELKFITDLENHWVTIQKYLHIFNLIQQYCPKLELKDSQLRIVKSEIYNRLNEKEKFIIYLYNNNALNENTAVKFPEKINKSLISESIGYLFKKTEDDSFFLSEIGIEYHRFLKKDLSDLIYNNKEIDDIFGKITEFDLIDTGSEAIEIMQDFLKGKEYKLKNSKINWELHETQTESPISMNLFKSSDSTESKLEKYPSLI